MSGSRASGYQGFKSFAMQECSTLKPGETYQGRATKFSHMGTQIITPTSINRIGRHAHESIAMQNAQQVQPSNYRVPDKRGVNANEKLPQHLPFVAASTYQQDFVLHDAELKHVLSVTLDKYEAAFESIAEESQHTIELTQVSAVLKLALGDTAMNRVREIFLSCLDHRGSTRSRITWEAFRETIGRVYETLEIELEMLAKKAMRTGSSATRTDATKIIPATTPSSSYKLDFGDYGDNPRDRPYMRKRGMASTTSDLNPGTSRDTYQTPGYGGFLPQTSHNPQAIAQADGVNSHPPRDILRLYYSDNIPGYTGHKPVDCVNVRGECRAGSDLSTTTGSDYRPHL